MPHESVPNSPLTGTFRYEQTLLGSKPTMVDGSYTYIPHDPALDPQKLSEILSEGVAGLRKQSTEIHKGSRAKSILNIGNDRVLIFWSAPQSQRLESQKSKYVNEILRTITTQDIDETITFMKQTKDKDIALVLEAEDFSHKISFRAPRLRGVIDMERDGRKLYFPLYEYIEGKDADQAQDLIDQVFEGKVTWNMIQAFLDYFEVTIEKRGARQTDEINVNKMLCVKDGKLEIVFTDLESIELSAHPELTDDSDDRRPGQKKTPT